MRSSGSMMAADLIAVQLRKHASAASWPRSAIVPRDPLEVVAIHQKSPAGTARFTTSRMAKLD